MSHGLENIFGGTAPAGSRPDPRAGRWRRRLRRLVTVTLVLTVTGGLAGLAAGYLLGSQLSSDLRRINDAFKGLDPSTRPSPASSAAADHTRTILAVALDARAPGQNGDRSDTIMLIRFDPDKHSASVVSIPRDSWVPVPGRGRAKINAAYAWGGRSLLIQTVELLTDVRVDHFLVIDLDGFKSIVDDLHGVDVGVNHLNGSQALAYVRRRSGLPDGDLDRVRRQQNLLRAVMTKIVSINPAGDPVQTHRLLDAMTRAVTVDDGYPNDEVGSALAAVRMTSGNTWFLTAPITGTGREGDQSVVYLDATRDNPLWQAMADDTMPAYVAAHRGDLLAATTP